MTTSTSSDAGKPRSRDYRHFRTTKKIRAFATDYLNATQTLADLMADGSVHDVAHLVYQNRTVASANARALAKLQAKRSGTDADQIGFKHLLIGKTAVVRSTLADASVAPAALSEVAAAVVTSKVNDICKVPKSVLRDALSLRKIVMSATEIDPTAAYEANDLDFDLRKEINAAVATCRSSAVALIDALEPACTPTKPATPKSKRKDQVHIRTCSDILLNGKPVAVIAPRKAALFLLILLGTDHVNVDEFAKLYAPTSAHSRSRNSANSTSQALHGLKKTFKTLTVTKLGPKFRRIDGVLIKCDVPEDDLRDALTVMRG